MSFIFTAYLLLSLFYFLYLLINPLPHSIVLYLPLLSSISIITLPILLSSISLYLLLPSSISLIKIPLIKKLAAPEYQEQPEATILEV